MLQRAQEAVTAVMGNLKLATSSKDNDVHESQPRSPTTSARHPVNEEKDDEEKKESIEKERKRKKQSTLSMWNSESQTLWN